ncbi:MAG: hypothetical protein K2W82_15755 [Candidatus Obscuribacterales bacterium]|nr:hypothetical protein [Candidatus Obscuribacterales bacterium]
MTDTIHTVQILERGQVGVGKYLYQRPGWTKWIPAEVRDGQGDFNGHLMVHFYSDTIPTMLKNVPADAQFQQRPDSENIELPASSSSS